MFVTVDNTRDDVSLPEHLPKEGVQLAFSQRFQLPLMQVNEGSIVATLSFKGRGEMKCRIPWDAVSHITFESKDRDSVIGRVWPLGGPEQAQGRLLVSMKATTEDPPTNEEIAALFKEKAREVHLASDFVGATENLFDDGIHAKPAESVQDRILQYGFPFNTAKEETSYVH